MKLPKQLSWLLPYINSVPLPDHKVLTRVSAFNIRNNRNGLDRWGSCHSDDEIHYRIYLHTHQDPKNPKKLSKLEVLCVLAHELAHISYWEHSPEHKTLESEYASMFMKLLKESGYTSEEDELGET